jgi:hypothetical protein
MAIFLEVEVRPADFREQTVSAHYLKSVGIPFLENTSFMDIKILKMKKELLKN